MFIAASRVFVGAAPFAEDAAKSCVHAVLEELLVIAQLFSTFASALIFAVGAVPDAGKETPGVLPVAGFTRFNAVAAPRPIPLAVGRRCSDLSSVADERSQRPGARDGSGFVDDHTCAALNRRAAPEHRCERDCAIRRAHTGRGTSARNEIHDRVAVRTCGAPGCKCPCGVRCDWSVQQRGWSGAVARCSRSIKLHARSGNRQTSGAYNSREARQGVVFRRSRLCWARYICGLTTVRLAGSAGTARASRVGHGGAAARNRRATLHSACMRIANRIRPVFQRE